MEAKFASWDEKGWKLERQIVIDEKIKQNNVQRSRDYKKYI